jgi:hypothetical protein
MFQVKNKKEYSVFIDDISVHMRPGEIIDLDKVIGYKKNGSKDIAKAIGLNEIEVIFEKQKTSASTMTLIPFNIEDNMENSNIIIEDVMIINDNTEKFSKILKENVNVR